MAQIGLQYLLCATLAETDTKAEYSNGMVMAGAIKADISIEINEAKLYADNRISENIKEFKSGKLTLNGDDLPLEVRALILGHTIIEGEDGEQGLVAKGDDDGAFVGIGFYATTVKNNVRKYRALWLHKVKFGIPNESMETKGESITFQTPTIEGTILTDVLGVWKEEMIFSKEAEAKAWLNEKAALTVTGSGE